MTKDKITDKYIKAVQKQFKHYHTTDARFISDLKDAVISYAAQQDSLDYEQLVSQFGDPQELVVFKLLLHSLYIFIRNFILGHCLPLLPPV